MRMRDGKSISEISRLTSLSRNTIKQWLQTPQGSVPNTRRIDAARRLAGRRPGRAGGRLHRQGPQIDIFDWQDRETTLAAL
ncbi:MAG: hypothetical protein ABI224_11280 [Acetobacteraceae bacterium]